MSVADDGLPSGFRLAFDQAAWIERDGSLLIGGEPFAIVRLAAGDAAAVCAWHAGASVGEDARERRLAGALVAANLATPVPHAGAAAVMVSVVVPVRDRPAGLERLLKALATTDEVGQVVVVDDASRDRGAVCRATERWGAELVRRDHAGGPAAARNAGLTRADRPLVVFIDSDCLPRPGWLAAVLPHFEDPAVALVAPRVVPCCEPKGSALARYEAVRSSADRGPLGATVRPGGRVPFLPGAALVARSASLGDGFDGTLAGGEDVELSWRLAREGRGVRYEPAGVVEHHQHPDLRRWVGRRVAYGRHAAPLARRHPGCARPLGVSPWTAAAWTAAGLRRPVAAAGVTAAACALLARDLEASGGRGRGWALRTAWSLAGGGTLRSGRAVADALARTWAPVLLPAAWAVPRLRGPLAAAALAPALLDWPGARSDLDPLRWTALRVADDVAYGSGVWVGCLRERVWDPLRPDLGWRLAVLSGTAFIEQHTSVVH